MNDILLKNVSVAIIGLVMFFCLLNVRAHEDKNGHQQLKDAMDRGAINVQNKLKTALDANRNISVLEVSLEPGYREPNHTHPGAEVVYVISGEGRLWLNNEAVVIKKGDVLHVAEGTIKSLENSSNSKELVILAYLVVANNQPPISFSF